MKIVCKQDSALLIVRTLVNVCLQINLTYNIWIFQ